MEFNAFRLFAIGSKQTSNSGVPEALRLSLEVLEERALLSASNVPVFCGPPTYEAWLAQQSLLAETLDASTRITAVSVSVENSADQTLYRTSASENFHTSPSALQNVYRQYLDEDFVDEDDELEESIEVVSVTNQKMTKAERVLLTGR